MRRSAVGTDQPGIPGYTAWLRTTVLETGGMAREYDEVAQLPTFAPTSRRTGRAST